MWVNAQKLKNDQGRFLTEKDLAPVVHFHDEYYKINDKVSVASGLKRMGGAWDPPLILDITPPRLMKFAITKDANGNIIGTVKIRWLWYKYNRATLDIAHNGKSQTLSFVSAAGGKNFVRGYGNTYTIDKDESYDYNMCRLTVNITGLESAEDFDVAGIVDSYDAFITLSENGKNPIGLPVIHWLL